MRDLRADAIPAITITPNPALSDEPVYIRLPGCAPGQRVTLRAEMADDAGQRWRSWGPRVARSWRYSWAPHFHRWAR